LLLVPLMQQGLAATPTLVSDQLCVTVFPVWVLNQQVTGPFTACVPSPV
jgi:hypothetical protein